MIAISPSKKAQATETIDIMEVSAIGVQPAAEIPHANSDLPLYLAKAREQKGGFTRLQICENSSNRLKKLSKHADTVSTTHFKLKIKNVIKITATWHDNNDENKKARRPMSPEYYGANQKELNNRPDPTSIKCRYGNTNIYYQKDTQGRTIQISRPAIVKIK